MTKQRHSNRLDATRKTGRFWGYLRRAFVGVLSRNQNKQRNQLKLTMTNSQESDSIAEKPEVVKTKPKSNTCNWKTATIVLATACAVTIAGLFAINPKILNAAEPPPVTTQPVTPPSPPPTSTPPAGKRVPIGGWIYWVLIALEIAANAITIKNELTGEVDRVDVENNRPRDKSVTIEAQPEISLSYAKKNPLFGITGMTLENLEVFTKNGDQKVKLTKTEAGMLVTNTPVT